MVIVVSLGMCLYNQSILHWATKINKWIQAFTIAPGYLLDIWKDPIAKDTTYLSHETWRNQAGTGMATFIALADSMHDTLRWKVFNSLAPTIDCKLQ